MRPWFARIASYLAATAAAGMLLAVGCLLFSNWWIHRSGQQFDRYDSLADVPAREIAIVPGTGDRDGEIRIGLRSRLAAGLALYRAHKVKAILVSGVGQRPGGGDEVSSGRAWLLAHGMNPAHILTDPLGLRTLDTVQRAAKTYGVTSAIICTQRQHVDRTLFLARAAGIDAAAFLADQQHRQPSNFEIRLETLKAMLAVADTYLLHTTPRSLEPVATVAAAL